MKITPQQNRQLHQMLGGSVIDKEMKADLVMQFTNQRVSSSKDMYREECQNLINYLRATLPKEVSEDKQRKKIISNLRKYGMEKKEGKADMVRINNWCVQYGKLGKGINQYHGADLTELVTQSNILYRKFLKELKR